MSLLKLEHVNAFYGEAQVLHDLSIEVGPGERVAILGRNGVGKTTVVNACIGVARVRGGTISFMGQVPSAIRHFTAARSGIAVVPQGRRIVPGLTVRENLQLGAAVGRKGPWNFDTVCKLFPILLERADGLGTAMSGGQQQMLAIGRALMSRPRLLMLDEPSLGLAPLIARQIFDAIRTLNRQDGLTVLIVEQNANHALKLAHRGYVMVNGLITLSGTGRELLERPEIRAAYLEGGRRG